MANQYIFLAAYSVSFVFFLNQARQIHVSTDDVEVKIQLRQLQEPICMFYSLYFADLVKLFGYRMGA